MKKFKKWIVTVLATVGVCVGFAFAPVTAYADGTETSSVSEIVDETKEKTAASTFEEFLEWSKLEAEKYGHGDRYQEALEAIKTAATTKQVTISTLCSVGVALLVLGYIIVQKVRDKSYKKSVIELAEQLQALIKGTNDLVDETNGNGKTEKKTQAEVEHLEMQVQALQKGLHAFATAFLRFTDGVKLGDNKKNEVQTNCISAIKSFDEVAGNENNEE